MVTYMYVIGDCISCIMIGCAVRVQCIYSRLHGNWLLTILVSEFLYRGKHTYITLVSEVGRMAQDSTILPEVFC